AVHSPRAPLRRLRRLDDELPSAALFASVPRDGVRGMRLAATRLRRGARTALSLLLVRRRDAHSLKPVIHFEVARRAGAGGRTGRLGTLHGTVETPAFMPVGTYGTVRGLTPSQLREAGVAMLLCNAYHLALRPGAETIKKLGGLHRFMGW